MTNERIDAILGTEDELVPSSGFLAAVMERVQAETAAPPPIPFPWKRALPGLAALLLALAIVARMILTTAQSAIQSPATGNDWLAWFHSNTQSATLLRTQAAPVVLALAASCVCMLLCHKFIGGSTTR